MTVIVYNNHKQNCSPPNCEYFFLTFFEGFLLLFSFKSENMNSIYRRWCWRDIQKSKKTPNKFPRRKKNVEKFHEIFSYFILFVVFIMEKYKSELDFRCIYSCWQWCVCDMCWLLVVLHVYVTLYYWRQNYSCYNCNHIPYIFTVHSAYTRHVRSYLNNEMV